jgi:Ig-like domain from next to BRCA1 gene
MRQPSRALISLMLAAALLAGCNLPARVQATSAAQTAAAMTVAAALTAAVPSSTPTSTTAPFPTLPPVTATIATASPATTATSGCDDADFVTDVTFPDGTDVDAGDAFTKTWRLKNTGTCSWTPSYAVVFSSGESMGGPTVQSLTGNVNPGQTVDLSVALTAPASNGPHSGNWGLRNAAGVTFAHFWVKVTVGSGTGGPFAVTHVSYSLSTWSDAGHVNCPRVTAEITTSGPGTVTYHWTRSPSNTSSTDTLTFNSAGTKSINYDWALGSANSGTTNWVGIYIDDPNHQDFGHKEFTTACTSP